MELQIITIKRGVHLHPGFAIMEILMAIGIAAIVLALAIPSLRSISANNQVNSSNNAILTGLNLARTSAIIDGGSVSICPSLDGSACANNNWHRGWIVFDDADANGVAAANEVIRVLQLDNSTVQSGYGGSIVFQADGTTTLGANATITNCFSGDDYSGVCSEVFISEFGNIKAAEHVVTDPEPENTSPSEAT